MADKNELELEVVGGEKDDKCGCECYAGQILGKMIENEYLRDVKLVAGADEQK